MMNDTPIGSLNPEAVARLEHLRSQIGKAITHGARAFAITNDPERVYPAPEVGPHLSMSLLLDDIASILAVNERAQAHDRLLAMRNRLADANPDRYMAAGHGVVDQAMNTVLGGRATMEETARVLNIARATGFAEGLRVNVLEVGTRLADAGVEISLDYVPDAASPGEGRHIVVVDNYRADELERVRQMHTGVFSFLAGQGVTVDVYTDGLGVAPRYELKLNGEKWFYRGPKGLDAGVEAAGGDPVKAPEDNTPGAHLRKAADELRIAADALERMSKPAPPPIIKFDGAVTTENAKAVAAEFDRRFKATATEAEARGKARAAEIAREAGRQQPLRFGTLLDMGSPSFALHKGEPPPAEQHWPRRDAWTGAKDFG